MSTAIAVILLAVVWAAVLIPQWLEGRRENRPSATIRSFHRQLFLLGQAAPDTGPTALEAPARFRRASAPYSAVRFVGEDRGDVLLHDERRDGAAPRRRFGTGEDLGYDRDVDRADAYDDSYDVYADADGYPVDRRRVGRRYVDDLERYDDEVARHAGYGPDEAYDVEHLGYDPREAEARDVAGLAATYGLPAASARRWAQRAPRHPVANGAGRVGARGAARRRTEAYRRRRRVLAVLVATVAITLVWALVLQVTVAWAVHAVADLLLVSYLGLLARRGRRAAEQADKVRYLAPIEAPRPAVVVLHGGAAR